MDQFIACTDKTLRARLNGLREQAYEIELELKRRAAMRQQQDGDTDGKGLPT
jgi:hypothetical protein